MRKHQHRENNIGWPSSCRASSAMRRRPVPFCFVIFFPWDMLPLQSDGSMYCDHRLGYDDKNNNRGLLLLLLSRVHVQSNLWSRSIPNPSGFGELLASYLELAWDQFCNTRSPGNGFKILRMGVTDYLVSRTSPFGTYLLEGCVQRSMRDEGPLRRSRRTLYSA